MSTLKMAKLALRTMHVGKSVDDTDEPLLPVPRLQLRWGNNVLLQLWRLFLLLFVSQPFYTVNDHPQPLPP